MTYQRGLDGLSVHMGNPRRTGDTVTVDLTIDVEPFRRALQSVADNLRRAAPRLRAFTLAMARAEKGPEVFLAGLEGRYYVRGALDTRYSSEEGVTRLVQDILTGTELPGLSAHERAVVAAAVLTGWSQNDHRTMDCAACHGVGELAAMDASAVSPLHTWPCSWCDDGQQTGEQLRDFLAEYGGIRTHRYWGWASRRAALSQALTTLGLPSW